MKKNYLIKILSFILTICLYLSSIIPIYSTNFLHQDYGEIISENINIDLSGIEICVYYTESIPNDLDIEALGEKYSHSVYTDSKGKFIINKPSDNYSYSIALDSLPQGYGMKSFSQFVGINEPIKALEMSEIKSVDIYINGDGLGAHLYNNSGEKLYAKYEILINELDLEAQQSNISKINLNNIKNTNKINLRGSICASGQYYPFNKLLNISNNSTMQKIELFETVGAISKVQANKLIVEYINKKLNRDAFCDLEFKNFCYEFERDQLSSQKIFDTTLTPDSVVVPNTKSIKIKDNYYVELSYYDGFSDQYVELISTTIKKVFLDFCFNYYNRTPYTRESNGKKIYDIYVVETDGNHGGETIPSKVDNTSSIRIYNSIFNDNPPNISLKLEDMVAHELTHAMLFDVGIKKLWFHEALGMISGILYSGLYNPLYVDSAKYNSLESLFEIDPSQNRYSRLTFPLYIFENYGGWNALKSIIDTFSASGYSNSNENILNSISGIYYGKEYDYIDAFAGMATNNYEPSYFYSHSSEYGWNIPKNESILNVEETKKYCLSAMSYKYFVFVNETNQVYNIRTRVYAERDDEKITVSCLQVKENGSIVKSNTIFKNYHGVTIRVTDLGGANYNKIIMVALNKNISPSETVTAIATSIPYDESN